MTKGLSARKAWAIVEEAIKERFEPEECDVVYDLMTGGLIFTGEIMNATSTRLAERFPELLPACRKPDGDKRARDYQIPESVKTWELMAAA